MKAQPSARKRAYVDHPDFHKPDAEQSFFPDGETPPVLPPFIHLHDELFREQKMPAVLSREREQRLFLQYNYARYRAQKDNRWAKVARHLEEYLARANMLLVGFGYVNRRSVLVCVPVEEAYSEGMAALLRCINGFDASRGWKFSSYAVQAILNQLSGLAKKTAVKASRLSTLSLDFAEGHIVQRFNLKQEGDGPGDVEALRNALANNAAELTSQEQIALKLRFSDGLKLHEIAHQLRVTNERVRQILLRAQRKLRAVLVTEN